MDMISSAQIIYLVIVGALGWGVTALLNRIKRVGEVAEAHRAEQKKFDDLVRRLVFTLAENEIIRIHDDARRQEYITRYQLRTILALYRTCKDLGADGFLDTHINAAKQMPLKVDI
jgi:hypothetical protein